MRQQKKKIKKKKSLKGKPIKIQLGNQKRN